MNQSFPLFPESRPLDALRNPQSRPLCQSRYRTGFPGQDGESGQGRPVHLPLQATLLAGERQANGHQEQYAGKECLPVGMIIMFVANHQCPKKPQYLCRRIRPKLSAYSFLSSTAGFVFAALRSCPRTEAREMTNAIMTARAKIQS